MMKAQGLYSYAIENVNLGCSLQDYMKNNLVAHHVGFVISYR